jgi:hypothetical protein
MSMKRIVRSIFAVAIVCAFAWIAGFDFDERGVNAFFTAFLAASIALIFY